MPTRKRALLAFLLSLMLPGMGQIYNREVKKGWVIIGCALGLGLLAYGLAGFNRIAPGLALFILWMSAAIDAYKVAATAGRTAEFYYRRSYVVAMLLLVGPLALPLLWQSPNFARRGRWVWTVFVVGVALLFVATPYLLRLMIS